VTQVAISGMHSEQREAASKLLRRLRLRFSAATGSWQPGTTHLLCAALSRNDKTLCTMAAGGWVLGSGWLEASTAAGAVVPEQDHELCDCASGLISSGACGLAAAPLPCGSDACIVPAQLACGL
jgi:hypothetical protein